MLEFEEDECYSGKFPLEIWNDAFLPTSFKTYADVLKTPAAHPYPGTDFCPLR
jgi:hypothetical protein